MEKSIKTLVKEYKILNQKKHSLGQFFIYCCIHDKVDFNDSEISETIKKQYFVRFKGKSDKIMGDKYHGLFDSLCKYYKTKSYIIYAELVKEYSKQENLFEVYQDIINNELEAILYNEEIEKKQELIYNELKKANLWELNFSLSSFKKIDLSPEYKDFILNHLKQEFVRIPLYDNNETRKFDLIHIFINKLKNVWNDCQYKNLDSSITESTFSCQFIIHLVDFLRDNTTHIFQTAWNSVESVATKHRNNQDVGPRRCPDNFWFLK
ncbi:23103_t:CDS:2, partial [Gigaspora margarita]